MSATLTLIEQARATGDWSRLLEAGPYARFLGISLDEQQGRLVGRMKFAPHLVGNPTLPALHGGTLSGLLELAGQFELLYRAESVVLPKTITVTIDFLRSGKPVDTFVAAEIVKKGRRVSTVAARAWQDDPSKPIATANMQMLIKGA